MNIRYEIISDVPAGMSEFSKEAAGIFIQMYSPNAKIKQIWHAQKKSINVWKIVLCFEQRHLNSVIYVLKHQRILGMVYLI